MAAVVPLLRSPPFPGIDPAAAAIAVGPAAWHDVDAALVRETAAAMANARVGGAFWAAPLAGRSRLIVVGKGQALPAGDLGDAVVLIGDGRRRMAERRGALVPRTPVDPWPLIEAADTILAPSGSEIALLALAADKRGLTLVDAPLDGMEASLASALFGWRYRDPVSGEPIGVDEVIALLGRWRATITANRGLSAATGMAFWKRRAVARLLWDGRDGRPAFRKPAGAIARARREGGAVAAWPARVPADFAMRARTTGVDVRWVEDGFLRSAGLGSDLLPPLSLIVDDLRPYFDPAGPSRLERLLETATFDAALLARARSLRKTIIERRIGKYHVGGEAAHPDVPAGARLVLVVGQVEDDLSVRLGGGGLTNLSLMERARIGEPDAFIIYRPHPDVEAGHRKGAVADATALTLVDRVDRGGSLDGLLARADVLHTLTSLTGFEALMRGVRVVVHGSPFYAGWGLTDDLGPPLPRRTRRLTLDELVAGALILYPRYLDARTGLPCTPEQFIEGLGGVGVDAGWLVRLRRWQGRLMRQLGAR